MKRILLFSALGLAALLFVAPGAFAFGTKDVVKMSQEGISDRLIITKIENSGKIFRLDADDIEHLRDDGVSDKVIEAMLRTESEAGNDDEYYDYHAYPYRAYAYDPYYYSYPYYYPRSSFSFGLGLDFGHRYYGHNYYPRQYYPYSSGGSGSFGTTRERSSVGSRSGWWSGSGSTGSTSGGSTWSGRSSGSRTRTR